MPSSKDRNPCPVYANRLRDTLHQALSAHMAGAGCGDFHGECKVRYSGLTTEGKVKVRPRPPGVVGSAAGALWPIWLAGAPKVSTTCHAAALQVAQPLGPSRSPSCGPTPLGVRAGEIWGQGGGVTGLRPGKRGTPVVSACEPAAPWPAVPPGHPAIHPALDRPFACPHDCTHLLAGPQPPTRATPGRATR